MIRKNRSEEIKTLLEPVLGVVLLQYLVKLADGRQEHDQEDVLEAMDPLLALCSLTPNINLWFVKISICYNF